MSTSTHTRTRTRSHAEDLDLDELHEANTQFEAQIAEVSERLDAVRAAFDELARDCERVRTSLPTQRYGTYKRALRELLDEAIASVAPLLALQKPHTPQSPQSPQVLTVNVTAPFTVAVASAGAAASAPSASVPRSATSMSLAKMTQTAKQEASKAEVAATTAAMTAGAGDRERLVKQESVSTTDSAGSCRRPDGSEKAPMRKQNTLSKLEAVLRKQPTLTRLDSVSIAADASAVATAATGTPRSQKQEKENRSSMLSVLKRQSNLCHSETQLKSPSPTSTPGPEALARLPLAQQESLTSSQSQELQQKQLLTPQLGLFSRKESVGSGAQSVAASVAAWVRSSTPTTATASGTCPPPFEAKTGFFGHGAARRALAAAQPDSSASTPTFERR